MCEWVDESSAMHQVFKSLHLRVKEMSAIHTVTNHSNLCTLVRVLGDDYLQLVLRHYVSSLFYECVNETSATFQVIFHSMSLHSSVRVFMTPVEYTQS